jgi:hypothetical protein
MESDSDAILCMNAMDTLETMLQVVNSEPNYQSNQIKEHLYNSE